MLDFGLAKVHASPDDNAHLSHFELFYIGVDDRLMVVPIRFSPHAKTVELGTPVGLFATNVGSTANLAFRQQ